MNFDEQKKIFSQNLRRLLEERGLEQIAVAVALGVPPQTFNSWAKGKALPRMDKVQALADYLRIPKTALMDPPGTDPMLSAMLAVLKRAAFSYVSKARGFFGACGKLPAVHTFGPVFSKSLNGSLNEFPF